VNLPNLFAAGTRIRFYAHHEGFGGAFQPRAAGEDNGTRFLIRYFRVSANTHLYLPDAVAGPIALTPTAAGDLGYRAQLGQSHPAATPWCLRGFRRRRYRHGGIDSAPANGGTGPLTFSFASEVPLTGGSAYASLRVIDSSPTGSKLYSSHVLWDFEHHCAAVAQEPYLRPGLDRADGVPLPRRSPVLPIPPPSDCSLVCDCGASYFPRLTVNVSAIQLAAVAGRSNRRGRIHPHHQFRGWHLNWTATVSLLARIRLASS